MELLETLVLRGQAALGGHVDHEEGLALELREVGGAAVEHVDLGVVESHGGEPIPRTGHLLGPHEAVEFLTGEMAEDDGRLPERALVLVRVFGDGGGVVVADVRVERGHEHQRIADVLGDPLLVGLDADDGELAERVARVAEQSTECRKL